MNGYTLTHKRKGRYIDMTYYAVDYKGTLKEVNRKEYLRRMSKDDTFVAYKDDHYLLMTDSANNMEIVKHAILRMLQPNIYFDID